LEASSKDIGILGVFAYRKVVGKTELSVTIVACCFFGVGFAREFCQGNDSAVAKACTFAERCCRWERTGLAIVSMRHGDNHTNT
jgi:hypothetical protein